MFAYRYRDRLYRALVHGQDAGVVLGSASISWLKVLAVAVPALVALALIIALLARR